MKKNVIYLFSFVFISLIAFNNTALAESPVTKKASASGAKSVGGPSPVPTPVVEAAQNPAAEPTPLVELNTKSESTPAAVSAPSAVNTEVSQDKGPMWKLGPTIALTFPRVKELGLEFKAGSGFFSFGLISGGFKTKPTSEVSAEFSNYELRGRWHPFAGSFFLGVGYGKQNIKLEGTKEISSVPVTLNLDIESTYLMPHLGWFRVSDIGLTFGFDIGTILPSGVTSKMTSNASTAAESTSDYAKMKKDTEDAGDKLGKTSLPYMALFKIGWLF
jgi:hypothetical protein